MAKTAVHGAELDSLDRLEDKMKRLVGMIERMKSEQAHAAEENHRLKAEIESLRGRVASGETLSNEVAALRDERDVIRGRVSDMLQQLEALNL
ncbi:MAG TPA: cell division protein ZapB [Gemmatimonadaceae bacterium]|jgi:regulator of replication initiation timing|nr:cell division protein ZapB [Gemmatimonadaceae bacterium]